MKKALIVLVSVTVCLCLIGGYVLLDNMFPVAEPINCPDGEDVVSFSLAQSNGNAVAVGEADVVVFLEEMGAAQPTRIWSVQDYPSAKDYYTVEIQTSERQFRYFVYMDNSEVYVEAPYNGVYKANERLMDLCAEALEK